MAETKTPNYLWILPDLGGDASNWGTVINQTLTAIDAAVWSNQTNANLGSVPIGAAIDFWGLIPPTNYLPCNGSTYNVSDWPALGAMLAVGAATTFQTPNYGGRFSIGTNTTFTLGTTGGAMTVTLDTTMIPAHSHPVADPQHYHVVAAYTHTHGISDPSHVHSGAQDAHSHTVTINGSFGGGVGPQVPPSPLVNQGSEVLGTSGAQPNVYVYGAYTGITIAAAATGIPNTNFAATGITVGANTGGGQPTPTMPPWIAANKIIRAK